MSDADDARRTPLFDLHRELKGRIVDFAGWALPVRYDPGPVAEHLHTRLASSLFDVSHMGIVDLHGPNPGATAVALEALVPADVVGLAAGQQRYTMFTNHVGGVVDDLIVGAFGETLTVVVNASRRAVDRALLDEGLAGQGIEIVARDDLALLAIQGPEAVAAVATLAPGVDTLGFMGNGVFDVAGVGCRVSRSGYTGEDGLELQVPADAVVDVARALLAIPGVEPAGLAARDSLRLEAGLCLYGNDLDETTTPIEAGLAWSIPGRRRADGGFRGFDVIRSQLRDLPPRRRVGLRTEGRQPVRSGTELVDSSGVAVGTVTSGGYGPTFGGPIAMGYVVPTSSAPETRLVAIERGRELPVLVTAMPFIARRYQRKTSAQLFQEHP
jgi:aminomethyltransferase